jgi:uncharacterized membrane protein
MAKIHKSILIHAPVDKVFHYLIDPRNMPEIWPAMVEIRNVTPIPNGGTKFGWVYQMAGMHFEGESETTELIPNSLYVTHSTKGIESTFRWEFESVKNGTQINLETEYKIPIPLLGKLAEAVILKQNEHEAETTLKNLKDRMEIEMPMPA